MQISCGVGTYSGDCEHNTIWNNGTHGLQTVINTLTGNIRDIITWDNDDYDLNNLGAAVTITESNYETNNGFTIGAGCITTDPEFCKTSTPYKLGISASSGASHTGTGNDIMGANFRIIEINEKIL